MNDLVPSFGDPPFACPADIPPIVLDLPFPTSTNRLHHRSSGHVCKTKEYQAWIKACDHMVLLKRQYPRQRITGPFAVDILLNSKHRGDGDNRIKAVLDYLQSREITGNDINCRGGFWAWVAPSEAPEGCRVTVRQVTG